MGESKANMLFDPPYNINLSYSDGIGTKGKYGVKVSDNKSTAWLSRILTTILQNGLAVSESDTHVFTWCDENNIGLIQNIYQIIEVSHKRVCLWVKITKTWLPRLPLTRSTSHLWQQRQSVFSSDS